MIPQPRTVFVVDDDSVMLLILGGILRSAGHEVEAFDRPEALLNRLSANDRGCVVLDLRMPGLSGLDLQKALLARDVLLPLIFVSGQGNVPAIMSAMRGGAVDFLPKPVDPKELCALVDRALQKDAESAAKRAFRDVARARWMTLSRREQEVCGLFAKGLLNKQIAAALGLAESTVQAQRALIFEKLQVVTLGDLVRLMGQVGDEG